MMAWGTCMPNSFIKLFFSIQNTNTMKTKFYHKPVLVNYKNYTVNLILFIILIALNTTGSAQNFHLVKDINTSTDGYPTNFNNNVYNFSNYYAYAVLNGISYFGADDGIHGRGLWRSDGTSEGTYQVKPGIDPNNIIVSNGKLYFVGSGLARLWTSDGTEAGTVPVLDVVPPGLGNFTPSGLTDFNGTVFFAINGRAFKDQLWKTDGTANGTVLVKDFYSTDFNNSGFSLIDLRAIKNKLYFSVFYYSPGYVSRLWVTDGSPEGTNLISNSLAEAAQLVAHSADNADPLVYFTAAPYMGGPRSLYVTNGEPGVAGVASGFTGTISSTYFSQDLVNIGGVIYFIGRDNNQNNGLFKFDIYAGTGTQPVKLVTGTIAYVSYLNELNGVLLFSVYGAPDYRLQLWKSDGSSLGNVLLKDSLTSYSFYKANGQLYFNGNGEVWKSDGTANGTVLLKDVNAGKNPSNPFVFTYVNNKILFTANDGVHGMELWQTDGTETGTILLKDINQTTTASSGPNSLITFNDKVIFNAYEGLGDFRRKLLITDGSAGGTSFISDSIYTNGFNQGLVKVKGNEGYFWGFSASGKQGFYKTDGTAAGTSLFKDFTGIPISFYGLTATDNLVYYFIYNQSTVSYELWRTDGTNANTFVIKNDFNYFDIRNFIPAGNTLYFVTPNTNSLWKTDGTVAGTVMVRDFDNSLNNLSVHNGMAYFSNYDGSNNYLWKSDGTDIGTVRVSSNKVSEPSNLISLNGQLFFTANANAAVYGDIGTELFKTDGTDNGTVLLKDIHPGNSSTTVYRPISVNGILYFFTDGASFGKIELWRSDGTADGTYLVKNTGNGSAPQNVVSCNGKLFFVFNNRLWESDGTQAGTHFVEDNIFTALTIDNFSANLTSAGNQIFFTAYNYQYGNELYAGTISSGGGLPIALTSFTATLKQSNGLLEWSTASEHNNSHFNVQRSTDAINFETIANIKSAGNSSQTLNYTYIDSNITSLDSDKIYYRLQQVDHDGKATLSNIEVITINQAKPQITIAPNPVQNSINIYSNANINNARISVIDMNGRVLSVSRQNITEGQRVQIESGGLVKGVYVVKIENGVVMKQIKVVKE
jgi:ELWxxDGT repeat protein